MTTSSAIATRILRLSLTSCFSSLCQTVGLMDPPLKEFGPGFYRGRMNGGLRFGNISLTVRRNPCDKKFLYIRGMIWYFEAI
jgi:hypothetical protein